MKTVTINTMTNSWQQCHDTVTRIERDEPNFKPKKALSTE